MGNSVALTGNGPIVLVDDDQADAWLLRRCFERSRLANEFVWIASGLGLIEYLRGVEAHDIPAPALIMLDIRTAGLDGLLTLKLLETATRESRPGIVVLMDSRDPIGCDKAIRLGEYALRAKSADVTETIEFFNSLATEREPDPAGRHSAR
jgi:CheY-like chemotaxis protein